MCSEWRSISKGAHFPKNVILYAVFFYVRYPVAAV
ncbi:IS6 family transposase, partial [Brucella abortus]